MADTVSIVLNLTVLALGGASLVVWLNALGRLRAGQPLVPGEPREATGALDLYVAFVIYLAALFTYAWATKGPATIEKAAAEAATLDWRALATHSVVALSAMALALAYLGLRLGQRYVLDRFALRPRADLALGLVTFVAAFTPIFLIQFVLTRFFPSEHPVQSMLTKDASAAVVALSAFAVVIVAPLTEEFVFRVLLQGWMETLVLRWRAGEREPAAAGQPGEESAPAVSEQASEALPPRLMPWPIVISSLIFALLHLKHGPDPIALFVFSLMLGYLYQKTHRLWPSLIVHACLNAWSLTILWLNLKLGLGQ
jgi:membrane protease YdiL (CAAX protease family)